MKNRILTMPLRVVSVLFLVAALCTSGCGPSGTPSAFKDLPASFEVDERVIAFTTTFDIVSGGKNYGTVSEHLISWGRTFTYTDGTGVQIATAKARVFSWGTHIDVYDASGRLIGSIKEEILNSLFKVHTVYSILDASGNVVARSEKVEFFSTNIAMRAGGREIATLHRPVFNLAGDTWYVSVNDPSVVDMRVIIMIGAYKTAVDNERREAERNKNDEK